MVIIIARSPSVVFVFTYWTGLAALILISWLLLLPTDDPFLLYLRATRLLVSRKVWSIPPFLTLHQFWQFQPAPRKGICWVVVGWVVTSLFMVCCSPDLPNAVCYEGFEWPTSSSIPLSDQKTAWLKLMFRTLKMDSVIFKPRTAAINSSHDLLVVANVRHPQMCVTSAATFLVLVLSGTTVAHRDKTYTSTNTKRNTSTNHNGWKTLAGMENTCTDRK